MNLTERTSDYRILEINAATGAVTLRRDCFVSKDGVDIMSKAETAKVEDNAEIATLIGKILTTAVAAA
jgi:hypothetical protein